MPQYSLLGLKVKPGDAITALKWNELILQIEMQTPVAGLGTRLARMSAGTIVSPTTSGVASYNWPFKPIGGGNSVQFNTGLVGGVEPTIGGVPLSGDSSGNIPSLATSVGDLIYFQCDLDRTAFTINSVEIVALQTVPKATPYTAYKLLAQNKAARLVPVVFFNLGFWASAISPASGSFRGWFWAS